jgi:hypothetical protein
MTTPYFPASELHLLCIREEDGWRVHARPGALPFYLKPFFRKGEAFPVAEFDLNDLERFMGQRTAQYAAVSGRTGCVQLSANGESVPHLGKWLANAFASGIR